MDENNQAPDSNDDVDALDRPESPSQAAADTAEEIAPPKKKGGFKTLLKRFNIYLVAFIFILAIGVLIILIAFSQSKKGAKLNVKNSSISSGTLKQIANSDATVGGPSQILNVQANAVFAGQVLVRQALQVANGLQVTGNVGVNNINVSGTSTLQSATITKNLTVAGTLATQNSATFAQGIQVTGNSSFSGTVNIPTLTANTLTLNSDLTLSHHILISGAVPSSLSGSTLGSGGTTSVNGSDTAGNVNINTGSGPSAGCLITVIFKTPFTQTPYVIATPIGAASGQLGFYVVRSTTNFQICASNAPSGGTSYGFDYMVIG